MELKQKTSMEAIPKEEHVDMFSDLPDPIIHQIISFLSTKEAAQTSTLSKRLRNLRLTFPIIDLDIQQFSKYNYNLNERFLKYMHRTLETHDHTLTVQKLRISAPCLRPISNYKQLVDEYIELAVSSSVSVFELYLPEGYVVSSKLFALGSSLVYLRLQSCCFDDEYNVMNLKSLKSLQLGYVTNMTKETILKMISSSPLLETLILIDFPLRGNSTNTLEISHTSLKYLEVRHIWYINNLVLDVPKLLSLECSPKSALLEIKTFKDDSLCSLTTLRLSLLRMEEEHFQRLLSSLPHLERVELSRTKINIKEKTLKIIIAKLKDLVVEHCWGNNYEGSIMEVDTSNLESLIFILNLRNTYKIRDIGGMGFGRLTKLSISLDFLEDYCPKDDEGILLLSTCFPVLEDLTLCASSSDHLKFLSQSLKSLKFRSQSLKRLYMEFSMNTEVTDVNIDAPKLVFFKYCGDMIKVSNLIKSSQFEAELELYVSPGCPLSLPFSSYLGCQDTELMMLRNLVKMFDETRLLTLINMLAKLIEQTLKECGKTFLLNLSYTREMISIHLKSRIIELKFQNNVEVEEMDFSLKHHLIEVKLNNFEGDRNEMEFIRILFNEARILRTISISLKTDGIWKKSKMKNDMDRYPKLSPNVEYVFI